MSKYTPGPWIIAEMEAHRATRIGDLFLGIGSNTPRSDGSDGICRVSALALLDDEDKANANLIATAPELLQQLEIAERTIVEMLETLGRDAKLKHNVLPEIRAAIAKAKGEEETR